MNQQGGETGIPILTEVLETPVCGVDTPERRAQPRTPASVTSTAPTVTGDAGLYEADSVIAGESKPVDGVDTRVQTGTAGRSDASDTTAFDRIAANIRTQVLQQLLGRADTMLEQRIRDGLADNLQLAVAQLTAQLTVQLRQSLQQTLDELLTEAIAKARANQQIAEI